MKRLVATIYCDFRFQFRSGFYLTAAIVAGGWIFLLSFISKSNLGIMLPILILDGMIITTFWFIGGLVLFEKDEGTLEAQGVTPLKTWEYLLSKIATLTILTLVERILIIVFSYGFDFQWIPMILGIILLASLYILIGFLTISRFRTFNEYFLPSALIAIIFCIPPVIYYLEMWESWLFFLHPMLAPLLLFRAAFQPIGLWQWLYGFFYSVLWIVLLWILSQRAFRHFIISK